MQQIKLKCTLACLYTCNYPSTSLSLLISPSLPPSLSHSCSSSSPLSLLPHTMLHKVSAGAHVHCTVCVCHPLHDVMRDRVDLGHMHTYVLIAAAVNACLYLIVRIPMCTVHVRMCPMCSCTGHRAVCLHAHCRCTGASCVCVHVQCTCTCMYSTHQRQPNTRVLHVCNATRVYSHVIHTCSLAGVGFWSRAYNFCHITH